MKDFESLQEGHEGGIGQFRNNLGNDQKVVVGTKFFAFGELPFDDLDLVNDSASDHTHFLLDDYVFS